MPDFIGRSFGRYRILEQLGEGGMATVYKAYDTRLDRDVAIKIIRTDLFGSAVIEGILKRFEREAKGLARLTHPNIVGVIDYGEYEESPYLVMTYLVGGTLKNKLGKPIPWQEVVRLLLPVSQALDYAHKHNIIHRDVKPSNILLTEYGQPMLSDFGIAKILDIEAGQTLTGTGVGVGTPEYMAPEQWLGKASACSDIYSLGIVFYEMVTGRKPYIADTPAALLLKQSHDPLPPPTQFVPDLPGSVERVLVKALAKDPEDRYSDMAAFSLDMEGLLMGVERTMPAFASSEPPGGTPQEAPKEEPKGTSGKARKIRVQEPVNPPKEEPAASLPEEPILRTAIHPPEEKPPEQDALEDATISEPLQAGKPPEKGLKLKIHWSWLAGAAGVLLITVLLLAFGGRLGAALFPTEAPSQTSVHTEKATAANTSAPTLTSPPQPTATAELHVGSVLVRPADNMVMVYVPQGTFTMGYAKGYPDEQPAHTVTLDAFWIDRTEVTNAMYALCVSAGTCQPPDNYSSATRGSYYGTSQYADYPVIYVSWDAARAYCRWAGGQLPTEAQWELAARGTNNRIYPWGDSPPGCKLANYNGCFGDTSVVASFHAGRSVYDAFDMAGNVWEWVNDWYDGEYYSRSYAKNPQGPITGKYRVLRGGSWLYYQDGLRLSLRGGDIPEAAKNDIGFRCARTP
jgi:serine/threonine protein kinase/formylglycine-generating enzyme required for sulfatase activity